MKDSKNVVGQFILEYIDQMNVPPSFQKVLYQSLAIKGKILDDKNQHFCWGEFFLKLADIMAVKTDYQIPIAASVELFVLAADIFDDIADDDGIHHPWGEKSRGQSIALANWILMLSIELLGNIPCPQNLKIQLTHTLVKTGQKAAFGQWAEERKLLFANSEHIPTEEEYLDIIKNKAGSFTKLTCQMAAILKQRPYDDSCWNKFGEALGIAGQIENDARDIMSDEKSDLIEMKLTLPLAKALEHSLETNDGFYDWLNEIKMYKSKIYANRQKIRDYIQSCGSLDYCFILAEVYKQKAFQQLNFIYPVTNKDIDSLKNYMGMK